MRKQPETDLLILGGGAHYDSLAMPTKRKRKDEIFDDLKPFFCKAIVRLRGKRSQEALAKSAGMDPGTLRRLEKGDAPLRKDYIDGILRALEITYSDLLRSVAGCLEEAEREDGDSYRQMSGENLIRGLRKAKDAIDHLKREAREIKFEITRRQLPNPSGRR
jgi:transcriptional regulator with XRE-family HTH domain